MRKPVRDSSYVDYGLAAGGFLQGFMHILIAFMAVLRSSTSTESFTHLIIGVCLISCGWSLIKYEPVKDSRNVFVASIYIIQDAVRFYADINAYWGIIDIIASVGVLIFIYRDAIKGILESRGILSRP